MDHPTAGKCSVPDLSVCVSNPGDELMYTVWLELDADCGSSCSTTVIIKDSDIDRSLTCVQRRPEANDVTFLDAKQISSACFVYCSTLNEPG